MKVTVDEVVEQIVQLVSEYAFPLEVLQDVNRRLADCDDPYYAQQQLRYLKNIVASGRAIEREEKHG